MRFASLACFPFILTACATTRELPRGPWPDAPSTAATATPTIGESRSAPQGPPAAHQQPQTGGWRPGEAAMQGYFGASFLEVETKGGTIANVDDDIDFPTLGGGAQWKLAGQQVSFGIEGLFGFAWSGDAAAVAIGGGGAAVAVDLDLWMWDVYGGPFLSAPLGDKVRIYAGAGPLLRWAMYDQEGPTALSSGDGDGFGVGVYARTGIEFALSRGMMLGFGARWTDVEIDLHGRFGDLELNGIDGFVTVTQGF